MLPSPAFVNSPLRRAIWATAFVALFGTVVRYGWGAFDPEMRSWSLVLSSPVIGIVVYLQASARTDVLALFLMVIGSLGLLFWVLVALLGPFPLSTNGDWIAFGFLLTFPLASLVLGARQWRRRLNVSQAARTPR